MKVAFKVLLMSTFLLSSVARAEMLACEMIFENQTDSVFDQTEAIDLGPITTTQSSHILETRNFSLSISTIQDGGYGNIAIFVLDKLGTMIINTQMLTLPGVGFDYWDAQIPYSQTVTGLNEAGIEQQLIPEMVLFVCQTWINIEEVAP